MEVLAMPVTLQQALIPGSLSVSWVAILALLITAGLVYYAVKNDQKRHFFMGNRIIVILIAVLTLFVLGQGVQIPEFIAVVIQFIVTLVAVPAVLATLIVASLVGPKSKSKSHCY